MGKMPDLAESQASLMQGAKSHPGYCLKFIDTRSTQHQPLSSLPVSIPGAPGNGGPHTPSIPLTHSRPDTWARFLFALPRLISKRQDRHPADGDRRSPPQAVFNSALTPPPALLQGSATPHSREREAGLQWSQALLAGHTSASERRHRYSGLESSQVQPVFRTGCPEPFFGVWDHSWN